MGRAIKRCLDEIEYKTNHPFNNPNALKIKHHPLTTIFSNLEDLNK